MKRIVKAVICVVLVLLATCIILTVTGMMRYRYQSDPSHKALEQKAPVVPPELGFEVADLDDTLVIDTYSYAEAGSIKTLSIYDAAYLGLFFDCDRITAEQAKQTVKGNSAITPRFRELLYRYIDAFTRHYPDADLRILNYNLQTLKIVETDAHDLAFQALSLSAYGCYKQAENTIYVNKDCVYEPGTWEYQVLFHEISHAARSIRREIDGKMVNIAFSSEYIEIPEEALNSLFTVGLFDYDERDIAYQFPSNLFQVLLECLDDYTLSDYINHSLTYLAHKLDLQTGRTNYAMSIFRLIDAQRKDYMDDGYERDLSVYNPICDYVCQIYLDYHEAEGLDESEREALITELVEQLTYDVPEDYPVDTQELYRFARENR